MKTNLFRNRRMAFLPILALACAISCSTISRKSTVSGYDVRTTIELKTMDFSKQADSGFQAVSIPHTMNADDGFGRIPLERGDGYYRYSFQLDKADLQNDYIIQFEQAAQTAEVIFNGKTLHKNYSGYTPFAVKLTGAVEGENTLLVHTNNMRDSKIIPSSADFNFDNGMLGRVYLIQTGGLYFDPLVYGIDRAHVIPLSIGKDEAKFAVAASVFNCRETAVQGEVSVTLRDADGKTVLSRDVNVIFEQGGTNFYREFSFKNPILWQGLENPYLYQVDIEAKLGGKAVDRLRIPYGFRAVQLPPGTDGHLRLNGKEVVLRGVCLHQDSPLHAAALTDADRAEDLANILELGCNWLRCAHYPHNVSEFANYDRAGLMCQTEIPWVNTFNQSPELAERIHQYVFDMVNNLYNHPSIILWGLSNELGFSGWNNKPIGRDAVSLHNQCYLYTRQLDPFRLCGFVTHQWQIGTTSKNGLLADWYGNNPYPGWYTQEDFTKAKTVAKENEPFEKFYLHGISEYGFGANPFEHNSDYMSVYYGKKDNKSGTSIGVGGKLHPEEYQTFGHVSQWNAIAGTPAGKRLTFTSIWILNDFAVGSRNEGDQPGINDKGLITRDRKIKKDAYYFYKCVWNQADPELKIVSSRWKQRDTKDITITVFSNCSKVVLFRNGIEIQTLEAPTDSINHVVWQFNPVPFTDKAKTSGDVFRAVGYRGGSVVKEDTAVFTTTAI